jgi:peptidoglycan/LPS O-acetylase OafA/YrhL
MKDYIKRAIVITIFGAFLAYILYILIQGQVITTSEYAHLNLTSYIFFIAISLCIVALYGIYPIHIKFSRPALLVIGLALIILSQTIFVNDGAEGIFIGDIFSVIGVIILILFPTNLLTTDKVKKHKEKKNEIIIEV